MTLDHATSLFLARGFVPCDQLTYLGSVIPYVSYLSRGNLYVALTGYRGVFCEGSTEGYLTTRVTTRPKGKDFTKVVNGIKEPYSEWQKKGFAPITSSLFRDDTLQIALDSTTQA